MMSIESQMFWRARLSLVSKFSSPLLPVPPFDRSTGLPYPPNSLWTRLDGIWWNATGLGGADAMDWVPGESYVSPPLSDVFWPFGMSYGCATARFRSIYYTYHVCGVPDAFLRPDESYHTAQLTIPIPPIHSPPLYCRSFPGTSLMSLHIHTSPTHHLISEMSLDSVSPIATPLPPPISLLWHLGLLYCSHICLYNSPPCTYII
jgi:hypothetical protein